MTGRRRIRARLVQIATVPAAICTAVALGVLLWSRSSGPAPGAVASVLTIVGILAAGALAAGIGLVIAGPVAGDLERLAAHADASPTHGSVSDAVASVEELASIEQRLSRLSTELAEAREAAERRTDEAAAAAREQARDAARSSEHKTRLLGTLSHDLRQPLQAIGLFLASLRSGARDPETVELIDSVEECVTSVNDMLAAVLTLYRLDAGAVTPDVRVFPIAPLLYKVHLAYAGRALQKGISLRVVHTRAYVRGDPGLIEQCLTQLVSNAVRYTTHGGVVIGCRRASRKWLRVEVWDSGCGIPEEELPRVFEEFNRFHEGTQPPDERGLGLGLAIVRRLSQSMRARVDARSWPGRGSVFSLRLARAAGFGQERAAADEGLEPSDLGGGTILVIDDDERILTAMERLIHAWGGQPITAQTLDRALALCRASSTPPAVVVSDYWLGGGLDGNAAIEAIRAEFGVSVLGVLLTGDTSVEGTRKFDPRGNTLMYKPIRPEALHALLQRLLAEGGRRAA
jgi:two-component system, sensor histidine kinase